MSELLPCPFCGGEAAFVRNEECGDDGEPHENYGGEWVECAKCRACTNIRFPLKEPVKPLLAEQWNRRTAPASAQTPAGEDWGSHPLSGLHRSRESFDGAADAYEREYWSEQLQRKADADKARGALQPVSYYVADAIGRLQAQQRAAPPAQPSKVVAALRKWHEIYSQDVIRMNDTAARDPEKVAMVIALRAGTRAALAELGEGRS